MRRLTQLEGTGLIFTLAKIRGKLDLAAHRLPDQAAEIREVDKLAAEMIERLKNLMRR